MLGETEDRNGGKAFFSMPRKLRRHEWILLVGCLSAVVVFIILIGIGIDIMKQRSGTDESLVDSMSAYTDSEELNGVLPPLAMPETNTLVDPQTETILQDSKDTIRSEEENLTEKTAFTMYDLSYVEDFSEKHAWVRYWDVDKLYCALMNESGEAIFSEWAGYDWRRMGTMKNGITWYTYDDGTDDPPFVIINSQGEILFDSERNEEAGEELYLVGVSNGRFVVEKNKRNFSENVTTIFTMDEKGNVINPETKIENYAWECSGTPVGNGHLIYIYGTGVYIVYNIDTNELIYMPRDFFNSMAYDEGFFISNFGKVTSEAVFASQETYDALLFADGYAWDLGEANVWQNNNTVGEGLYYFGGNGNVPSGYYDLTGKWQFAPIIPNGGKIVETFAFSGEYAPIELEGMDGEKYISIIDKTGNLQYEPVKQNDVDGHWHGYVLVSNNGKHNIVLTPDGESKQIGLADLSEMGDEAYIEGYLSGGFFMDTYEHVYRSIDGKNTIHEIKVGQMY